MVCAVENLGSNTLPGGKRRGGGGASALASKLLSQVGQADLVSPLDLQTRRSTTRHLSAHSHSPALPQ